MVLNPLAPVYIAVLSLSVWALALRIREFAAVQAGHALPRRTTAGFLALVAALFGALWLSEIAASIASGSLPPSVATLAVPTSAAYALDLGFVCIRRVAMTVRTDLDIQRRSDEHVAHGD